MMPISDVLKGVTHPLIAEIYMKKDFSADRDAQILVIETNFAHDDSQDYDSCLVDLLLDLEDLKTQAETQMGKFDRVDIRTH